MKSSHVSYSVDVRPTFLFSVDIQFLELIQIFVVAQKKIKIFVIIVFLKRVLFFVKHAILMMKHTFGGGRLCYDIIDFHIGSLSYI